MRKLLLITTCLSLAACYTETLELADGGLPSTGSTSTSSSTSGSTSGASSSASGGTSGAASGSTSSVLSGQTSGTSNTIVAYGSSGGTSGGATSGSTSGATTTGSVTLEIRPTAVSFGFIPEGSSENDDISITIENTGTTESDPVVLAISGTNAGDFVESTNGCDVPLAPNTSCTYRLAFWPTLLGSETATLTASAGPGAQASAALSGTGIPAELVISPLDGGFGAQAIGNEGAPIMFTVTNVSSVATGTLAANVSGNDAADFVINPNAYDANGFLCPGFILEPMQSCQIFVNFTPSVAGGETASLTVSDTPANTATALLSGSGS